MLIQKRGCGRLKDKMINIEPFLGAITANFSEFEEELEPAPQHFEEGVTLTTEHLLEVDLGDASQKRPTFISTGLS